MIKIAKSAGTHVRTRHATARSGRAAAPLRRRPSRPRDPRRSGVGKAVPAVPERRLQPGRSARSTSPRFPAGQRLDGEQRLLLHETETSARLLQPGDSCGTDARSRRKSEQRHQRRHLGPAARRTSSGNEICLLGQPLDLAFAGANAAVSGLRRDHRGSSRSLPATSAEIWRGRHSLPIATLLRKEPCRQARRGHSHIIASAVGSRDKRVCSAISASTVDRPGHPNPVRGPSSPSP